MRYVGNRLTVEAREVPLEALLREVARQSRLNLVLPEPLAGRITITVRELSLDQGLRRILRDYSFTLEYPSERQPGTLWVYAKGTGARPVSPAARSSVPQTLPENAPPQDTFAREDPDISGATVEALADSSAPNAVQTLTEALRDPDQQVRESAIAALVDIGGEEAIQALSIALRDQEPGLREIAVAALGQLGGDSAIKLLQQALSDKDETVRQTAAEVLRQLQQQ